MPGRDLLDPVRPPGRRRSHGRPDTPLGSWAVGLAGASVVLLVSWETVGRLGGVAGLALGIAAGVVALRAIVRDEERGLTVFAAFLPFLIAAGFLLTELVRGHG